MPTDHMTNVLVTFPPRPLTDAEREILRAWATEVDDVFAFVSERRSDDPTVYRRIVISRNSTRQRLYLIRPPQGNDSWLVLSAVHGEDVARCPTLWAALNFVKPARAAAQPNQMRLGDLVGSGGP
ncbi:MAG TPA: hypothetical protein VND19_06325 [Acetobacteraceae bacterium]|nr:hypothetical protein [Acetobacteraceae bacterium]